MKKAIITSMIIFSFLCVVYELNQKKANVLPFIEHKIGNKYFNIGDDSAFLLNDNEILINNWIYNLSSKKFNKINTNTIKYIDKAINLKNSETLIFEKAITKTKVEIYNQETKSSKTRKELNICSTESGNNIEKIDNERIFIACKETGIYYPYTEKLEKIKSDYSIEASLMSKLPTGEILIIGENYDKQGKLKNVLIFNPKTKGFEEGSKMQEPRIPSQILSLNNGNKIILGGRYVKTNEISQKIEIYDYKKNHFSLIGEYPIKRKSKRISFLINEDTMYFPANYNELTYGAFIFAPIHDFINNHDKKAVCYTFNIKNKTIKEAKYCPKTIHSKTEFIKIDDKKTIMFGSNFYGNEIITFYTKYLE